MKDWVKNHQDKSSSWEAGEDAEPTKGRPKLDDSKKRKPRFTMNLNDEEFSIVVAASELDGQSQASFARQAVLEKARNKIRSLK